MTQYSKYFEQKERLNGDKFYCLKDNAPKELDNLVHETHHLLGSNLLNDWIYDQIHSAFIDLEDENCDNRVTIIDELQADPDYMLYVWFGNSYANEYIKEASHNFEINEKNQDIYELIGAGQLLAKKSIYQAVSNFLDYVNN